MGKEKEIGRETEKKENMWREKKSVCTRGRGIKLAPIEGEERNTSFCRRNNIILPIRFASIGTYSSWRKKKMDKRNKKKKREKEIEARSRRWFRCIR
ncbi:hypothetical protein ALC60_05208 [Trachymyrmex zeteki]|uniref:Uncharacterized protein n=1 Tax=Mycetomoellerius zeteki TaxID=64791 RepID=A0A151X6B2_9HYME|nr:hypothetical protein ALC60_05208 [Trachymyrmex zeteki]